MRNTYYITKYALTAGIMKVFGEECDIPGMINCGPGVYFRGSEWHTTIEAAEARVAAMVQAKLKSLSRRQSALNEMLLKGAKLEDRTK